MRLWLHDGHDWNDLGVWGGDCCALTKQGRAVVSRNLARLNIDSLFDPQALKWAVDPSASPDLQVAEARPVTLTGEVAVPADELQKPKRKRRKKAAADGPSDAEPERDSDDASQADSAE